MNRAKNLEQIHQTQEWDIAIVGGGASGLGIAVDAANRGFKTCSF
jgi:glycerol-3-phosphate dehydrogenase